MEIFVGKSIFKGIAIGKIRFYQKGQQQVKRSKIIDTEAEIARFEKAKETAIVQLKQLYEKALKEVGEANAMIFDVHAMMLEDGDYLDSIKNIISTQEINAEYAVASTGDNFAAMFAEMDDDYMKARAADVKDISERVIRILSGEDANVNELDEPVIIAADDLAPSETVQLDKEKLLAFVTKHGSSNSHTAILARTMNIPALIGIDIQEGWNGKMAVVDGYSGQLYIDPEEQVLSQMEKKLSEDLEKRKLLLELKGKENVTLDGHKIHVYANIGNVSDVVNVLKNDAGGIGLFRSEFLYLEKDHYPTEEEQFQVYKTVAENMAGKKVIIRTLDIGADKQVDYFELEKEENPAMGYRAIRICLDRPQVFRTQLRALFRASAYGNISIMFPMIISVNEVKKIKEIVEDVKKELTEQGISFKEVELGIMIETPAAVMISQELAQEVEFFSIGTNDLTQYTMSVDRGNDKVSYLYSTFNPAVLRSIQRIIECGRAEGIMVGMCGEAASDPMMIPLLLAFGLNEFSMSASAILKARKLITEYSIAELQAVAEKAMSFSTTKEVEAYMKEFAS